MTEFNVAEFVAKHATFTMELKDAVLRTFSKGGGCTYVCSRVGDYVGRLSGNGLLGFSYAYLIQLNVCLDRFFVPEILDQKGQYCNAGAGCWECNRYRAFAFREDFAKKKKEEVMKGLIGLCLDCVSNGRESFRTGGCRIKRAF